MLICVPLSGLGAYFGVRTVILIDQEILKPVIMILVFAVGIYTLINKKIGSTNEFSDLDIKLKHYIICGIFCFFMGFYDGFFGPGTGSFLIIFFILFTKMDFIRASGNAKAVNLASNVVAFATFAIEGKILYMLGLPVILFVMFFTWVGAKMAIKKGAKFIKPIFVTMSLLVSIKILYDMIITKQF